MTRWSSRLNDTNAAPMLNRSTGPSRRTSTRSTLTSAENGVPPKLKRRVPRVPESTRCAASRSTPPRLMSSNRTGTGNARTDKAVSAMGQRGTRRLSVSGRSARGSSCIELSAVQRSRQHLAATCLHNCDKMSAFKATLDSVIAESSALVAKNATCLQFCYAIVENILPKL